MQTLTQGVVCKKANDRQLALFAKWGMKKKHQKVSQPRHYLKEWREFRGFTQDALAQLVGTDKSVISLIEGYDRSLSPKWASRLAPKLRTTAGALISYDPNLIDTDILELWLTIPDDQKPQAIRVLQAFQKASA